jgi:adenylate cyclase
MSTLAPTLTTEKRQLAAVVFTDVVGYSARMQRDEASTIAMVEADFARMRTLCAEHGGDVLNSMGDGLLLCFPSARQAVLFALNVQEEFHVRKANAASETLEHRVGVHLGDVIFLENGTVAGDGVNIASRLESKAPPGGVCISQTVYDTVKGKLPMRATLIGPEKFKNIAEPILVWHIESEKAKPATVAAPDRSTVSIMVLPFANMSGDPEQEYFSDGITEDIITDLSKVSALWVAARNTAFMFKGKHVDVPQVAREHKVTHVLEGSVRKAGGRVRITAQLIEAAGGGHIWAERYDRQLDDIFALQDEISEAIVSALKLKLMPEEKKAIEQRSTTNPEAYKLYLMARQYSVTGNSGNYRRAEAIIRLCRRAIEIDPKYSRAWALMANAQIHLVLKEARPDDDAWATVERALALDENLAEAHAAKGRLLTMKKEFGRAQHEIEMALHLDPESYEVNVAAASYNFALRQLPNAIEHWEKAAASMETDYFAAGMLITAYTGMGDVEGARRAAMRTIERVEKIVASEPDNGSAMSMGVSALAALGEGERAKEWVERALLLDPDNRNMRYNLACTLVVYLRDFEAALDMLEPMFTTIGFESLNWWKVDPDLDPVREHPRFKAMLAEADRRLALPG